MVMEGMEQGAWGLSTGLWYAPMCHADRAENVAVCRAAGLFATHQRAYDGGLAAATEETIAIAEEAGVPVQLSHLQLSGADIAGHAEEILALLDRARVRGTHRPCDARLSPLVPSIGTGTRSSHGPTPNSMRRAASEGPHPGTGGGVA